MDWVCFALIWPIYWELTILDSKWGIKIFTFDHEICFVCSMKWIELCFIEIIEWIVPFWNNLNKKKECYMVSCWTHVRACRMYSNYFNGNIHLRVLMGIVEKSIEVTRRKRDHEFLEWYNFTDLQLLKFFFLRTYYPLQDKILWIVIIESAFDRISSCFAQRMTNQLLLLIMIIDNLIC